MNTGVKTLAMEMQRRNREAMPKTIPPWLAQFYVNQHVECSNDRTDWHDATVLEVHVWHNRVPGLRFVRPLQR